MNPTITIQELFNKMWAGLESQGGQKAIQDLACEYLTRDGKKCAVGHCLTDPGSAPYGGVCHVLSLSPAIRRDLGFPESREVYDPADSSDARLRFLRAAQCAHDNACDPEDMRDRLRRVGEMHGCTVPPGEAVSP